MIKRFASLFKPKKEKVEDSKIECAIDDQLVSCEEMNNSESLCSHGNLECSNNKLSSYTGVPAPAYLEDDPWFGPAPIRSEKQLDYMEYETAMKIEKETRREEEGEEPENIHELMYEIASKNWNTVEETQGGSENFQEGPGGWTSGNGWSQFA